MLTLFEAARWAPSTYNDQEWRFLYAWRDSPSWAVFFDLLAEGNRVWCQRAALLSLIVALKVFGTNGKPNPIHLFDSGLAFENLALQGQRYETGGSRHAKEGLSLAEQNHKQRVGGGLFAEWL
jgi:hypothetical protein